jgi:phosphoribosylformylglycinamidine synthase subunit PurL
VRADRLVHARAQGRGNTLLLAGSQTGRDGIHGASFASLELDASAEERRPAVQVGNPFLEKCLLEACMELQDVEGVVAVQDLGAAGLTSSVAECAARAGAGARLEVSRVPRRETGMTPYEVMLSESQERMLVVVEKGREAAVREVFARWDLEAADVGEVTDDGLLVVLEEGRAVARLPVQLLTEGAPVRMLESQIGGAPPPFDAEALGADLAPPGDVLLRLLGSPNLCSRRSIFRRYDHMVGDATVVPPGGDAAVLRINGSTLGLALSIDGNGRYCELDPFQGGQIAVVEAARNVIATGARPLAVTDCLNFGNPERPHVYWQLGEAVAGITAACQALDIPVVSGNVSLYNESEASGSIYPTPVIGMVGLLADYRRRLAAGLQAAGDFVLLVGETRHELGATEYLKVIHGQVAGRPPQVDMARELAVRDFVLSAAGGGLLRSAHDVAEGGMLVALAECCLLGGIGVRCAGLAADGDLDLANSFFGESQGRYVISAGSRAMPELQTLARRHRVELLLLGLTGGDSLEFEGQLKVGLAELREVWESGLA